MAPESYLAHLTKKIEFPELISKLTNLGIVVKQSPTRIRFTPSSPDWPDMFFNSNGIIEIETTTKNRTEIKDYLQTLAECVGIEIDFD